MLNNVVDKLSEQFHDPREGELGGRRSVLLLLSGTASDPSRGYADVNERRCAGTSLSLEMMSKK